jgi:hypothetical protein
VIVCSSEKHFDGGSLSFTVCPSEPFYHSKFDLVCYGILDRLEREVEDGHTIFITRDNFHSIPKKGPRCIRDKGGPVKMVVIEDISIVEITLFVGKMFVRLFDGKLK